MAHCYFNGGFNRSVQRGRIWVVSGGASWRTGRPGLSTDQRRGLWTRWKDGQSLSDIDRALGRHSGSVLRVVLAKGGIAPPLCKRSRLSLTLPEREEVSRGLIAGRSFHQIAAQLGRAPSTICREVNRNQGRAQQCATL